mmetsp:Transcript_41247/g.129584  ORF Transcript_41247/g.129584 Transcript_41247/m.129584 type:complete len:413 (+) Transcript_41247:221-1459(+)
MGQHDMHALSRNFDASIAHAGWIMAFQLTRIICTTRQRGNEMLPSCCMHLKRSMGWTSMHSSFAPPNGVNFLRGGGSSSVPALRTQSGRRSMSSDSRNAHKLVMSFAGHVWSTVLTIGKFAAIPYAGLLIVLYASQRSILYQKPNVFAEPTINGGRLVRLTAEQPLASNFLDSEGAGEASRALVSALFFPPKSPELPTIVYFHGNADQIGWGASYIGKVIHDLYGFGFYGVEYPGYGTSEGLKTCEESIYLSSVQLVNHLQSPDGLNIPKERTIFVGQSVGSGVAVELASRGLAGGMLLISPFSSILAMARTSFPIISFGLRLLPWLVRDKFDNLGKASKIDIPTVVLHGDEDEIVPYSQGAQLSKAIKGSRLVTIEGGGHNNLFGSRFEQQVLDSIALLAKSTATVEQKKP